MQCPITLPYSRLPCFTDYESFFIPTVAYVCLTKKKKRNMQPCGTALPLWVGKRSMCSSNSTRAWHRTLMYLSSLRSCSDNSIEERHIECVCVSSLLALLHMCNDIGGWADRPKAILKTPATPVHPGTPCLLATVTAAMAAGLMLPRQRPVSLAGVTVAPSC